MARAPASAMPRKRRLQAAPILRKAIGSRYSPSVSSEALPPAAVVFTVSVRSVTKRSR